MAKSSIDGFSLAPGIAEGKLCFFKSLFAKSDGVGPVAAVDPEEEIRRFRQQVDSLTKDLQGTVERLEAESLSKEADIIRAHVLVLKDPEFQQRVHEAILQAQLAADIAVEHVVEEILEILEQGGCPVNVEFATDLNDLAIQLRRKLVSGRSDFLSDQISRVSEPVLVLPKLLPSVVLEARLLGVKAFIVENGTALSHAVILARSFDQPVVRVSALHTLQTHNGDRILVDGDNGELLIEPDEEDLTHIRKHDIAVVGEDENRSLPVRIWVNIITPEQLEGLDWYSVEGVGLYRTESLFMQKRDDFPSEEEQYRTYAKLFELCGNRPVTLRTLDIGADKTLSYMSLGHQENPQLGLRAHRLYRYHPELLITQIRAVLRAAAGVQQLRILYPMIASIEQWEYMQVLTDEAIVSLRSDKVAFQNEFERGPLIETPAAVWSFSRLIELADFASVGTNDLVQYMFAVDRNNANVANLYQPDSPIILQVLKKLADEARAAGKSLSLCGEIAADLNLLPLLVGLELENLSVAVGSVESVQIGMRSLDIPACRDLAERCLAAADFREVRAILGRWPDARPEAESEATGEVIDPMCKMAVSPMSAPFALMHNESWYYFCSRRCMNLFKDKLQSC